MKTKIVPILGVVCLISLLFPSCEDTNYKEYTGYAPVYLSYDELRASVSEPREMDLENPGKIYFNDNAAYWTIQRCSSP